MLLISVVIPLYNKEPYVPRALNSVLSQTYQEFEVIIVDDGSTDKSAEVVKSFTDPRIRLIQQENAGVSAARNRGVREAKTDMIAFLDADDEWKPEFLETVLRLRKKHPEAGAYFTAYEILCKNGELIKPRYKSIPSYSWEGILPSYFLFATLIPMPISTSAICIPKNVFYECGGFLEGVCMREDSDLWGKIALRYPIAFSWKTGSIYHLEAENRACEKASSLLLEEHPFKATAIKKIREGEVPLEMMGDLQEYLNSLDIYFGINNLYMGNRKRALDILFHTKTKLLYKKKIMWLILSVLPLSIYHLLIKVKRLPSNL